MNANNHSDKARARARFCLEAYGADLSRWPVQDRASLAHLVGDAALAGDVAAAADLDAMLEAETSPAMSDSLERRLLADFDALPGRAAPAGDWARRLLAVFSFGPAGLAPAGAAACAAVLGLTLGVVTTGGAPVTPEAEALAFAEDAMVFAEFSEEGDGLWDAE